MTLSTTLEAIKIDAILQEQNINGFEAPGGTDKQTIHSYGPVYEALMEPLVGKAATILEVGVAHGGSMMLWHELLPQGHIIGLDVINAVHPCIFPRMEDSRYHFLMGDAYSATALETVKTLAPSGIDFAIDDGPHTLESQCAFIHAYVPLLQDEGIAVIEDVQDFSWFDTLKMCVPKNCSYDIVDRRAIKGRYDDLMLIIKRASNG
jgi:hypothetical protein